MPSPFGPTAPAARAGAPSGGSDRAPALLRLARAIVFATVCGAVSAAGHALAGGGLVPFGAYLAGVLAALGLAYLVDGRERGLPAVLAATVVTQLVLHQLFERLAPAAAARTGPFSEAGHAAHGYPSYGMVLAHLTVAALTAWWLHRGERALWLMIRLHGAPRPAVRLLFFAPVPDLAGAGSRAPRPVTPDVPARQGRTVPGTISRRGPPAAARR